MVSVSLHILDLPYLALDQIPFSFLTNATELFF
jgi:hypothetical protein